MNKLSIFLGSGGIIVLILAVVLGFVIFPKSVDNKIKKELKLVRGSAVWNKWIDIESPIYISFYIFNVTNPDQVDYGSQTPKLDEVGPYVYRQRRQKIDPHSESCKHTVKYEQKITYWFDEKQSGGGRTEKDVVNIVNVPFISVITGLANAGLPSEKIAKISSILSAEHLVRREVAVGDVLFKGFDVSNYNHPALAPLLPPEFSGWRFGLYRGKNESTDGVYEIYTAAKFSHWSKFGHIKTWNGNSMLPYWNNSRECNQLTGTDGSIFPPLLKKEDSVTIFNSDLCRLLKLTYNEEVIVKDIKGYRFTPSKELLQGAANNPDNQCYCLRKNISECQDGIIDVSVCRNGAPIVLSTPYWLDGYEGYAKAVGLETKANREKHETRIDIEPRTGLLLEAHKKIQINVEVKKIEGSPQLENVKNAFLFPTIWLDEEASICDVDVDDLKSRIEKPIKIVTIVKWVAIGVGIVLIMLAVAAPHACKKIKKDSATMIPKTAY